MKYLMIIGDGMADERIDALGGRTPLEYTACPNLARLAGGELGRIRTCPEGMPPGSDVAFLTLMGHDAKKCYRGRSPLEAAGEGVTLKEGEVSFRVNLISLSESDGKDVIASYNGDGVDGEEAREIASYLVNDPEFSDICARAGMRFTVTDTFRQIAVMRADDTPFELTPPHDITGQDIALYLPRGQKADVLNDLQNAARRILPRHPLNRRRAEEGRLTVNGIWIWGAGRATVLESFADKFSRSGSVITAVPLVRGIALLSGLKSPRVPGATGALDTNYQGKVDAALHALIDLDDDFVLLHLEAPDDLSHLGDVQGKVESIRRFDERMIGPVLKALDERGEAYRALVMPDHYTLLRTMTHDGTPVPYALYDSEKHGPARLFCEAACEDVALTESGEALLRKLFR